jgi:3-oxoacyl-[acyl-carrier-protein] synthase-3
MARLAAITAVSGYLPPFVLTNTDLEKMVDTNEEWIVSRTGIRQRHILKGEGLGTSDMAAPAVKDLLAQRGLEATDIDLLICATVTPDLVFPATANIICDKIGANRTFGFDLTAACSSFIYALTVGAKFIESGTHKRVVVVGADKMSSIIDYNDRATCIIFGDGAGAVLLEPSEDGNGLIDSVHYSDGSGRTFLHQKAGGSVKPASHATIEAREHFVYQEGAVVFKAAVKGMSEVVQEVMQRNHLTTENVKWLVPHQANKRIIDTVARMADFPIEKVMINIDKYGNTTSATIPLCLWEWQNQLKAGDNLILTAFGGGFTWGAIYLKWAIG